MYHLLDLKYYLCFKVNILKSYALKIYYNITIVNFKPNF